MTQEQKVGQLTKLNLTIEAGTSKHHMDITPHAISHELMVGIGPQGYSPFEYELLGKEMGDTLHLTLPVDGMEEFFEHLPIPTLNTTGTDPIHLQVHIDRISVPDQAEIIRAMASLSACGDHCCGGH
ncbi:MAG: hypothetical protein ACLFUT_11440 [Desulfobacteraceae bacterium]